MWQNIQMHIKGKWRRHSDAAQAAFVTHCSGVRSQEKKDDQVSGTGRTKGSNVSGADQGYPTRKDCLPSRARPIPRLTAVTVLPTPPFWLQRAVIFALFFMCDSSIKYLVCLSSLFRHYSTGFWQSHIVFSRCFDRFPFTNLTCHQTMSVTENLLALKIKRTFVKGDFT